MTRLALFALGCTPADDAAVGPSADRSQASVASARPHTAACSGRSGQPDVVIVSIDTLRADRLGYMGYAGARTPVLDAVAAAGTVFRQATTPVPRTTPALASMMTG